MSVFTISGKLPWPYCFFNRNLTPYPSKTLKVKEWPRPTSVQETQQFLILANYYRRFVKDFASITKPLHQLTEKKTPFEWTEQCKNAFSSLKLFLTSAPNLALPDWSKQFILDTDASNTGMGTVLSQCQSDGTEHIICYASRILTKSEKNHCVTQKELLPVVTYLQHFIQYLFSAPFTITTDHGALAWLQQLKEPKDSLQNYWRNCRNIILQLSIVQVTNIAYNAGALSRYPCRQCSRESHLMEQPIMTISSSNITRGYSSEDMSGFN